MRLIALLVAAAAATGAQAAAPPPAVEIKDAAARVTVVPEDRADVHVEIVAYNRRLPLALKQAGGRTIIDGGLDGTKIRGCRGTGAAAVVRVAGLGDVPLRDLPHVVVRMPRDVDVYAGGAVFGVVGRARNVTLGRAGCGDWIVANVTNLLQLSLAGSGDARTGQAGQAKLRVAGAGDIATAAVNGPLEVDVAGSGDVRVRSVAGPLDVNMAGSGDVVVEGGQASAMKVRVAGSGNVIFGGAAGSLTARIAGSGDVRAREVRGPIRKRVLGSGAVRIG